ncbi:2S proteasome subunit beta 2 [Nematocida displodere]|uniref:Proteasome subunit beta n=1 Tax=Nematocida displodere TaxID=1805483 RepID=A0A177ELK8_9MICR|nr:2S proteasome subunit beta 2 [Nematocida displodere]
MKGLSTPSFTKTGTTIVGIKGSDYVVLAADTRSTNGPIVANKNCSKIHRIADNIYCCGAGTAADTYFTTRMAEASLYRHQLKYERIPSPIHCINILKRHLFRYRGAVQASLIVGGLDADGPVLSGIHPHGSVDSLPYTAQGSGSYAAIGILESQYKVNMTMEEAVELASQAIEAGIRNDLYSGSNIDICTIQSDPAATFATKHTRSHKVIGKKEPSTTYSYPRQSIHIKKEQVYSLVSVTDAMEIHE